MERVALKRYREEDFIGEEDFVEEDSNEDQPSRKRIKMDHNQVEENTSEEKMDEIEIVTDNSKMKIEELQQSIKLLLPMETLISFKFHSPSTKQQE